VVLWDLTRGRPHRTLYGHWEDAEAVAVSPDGKFLLTGAEDRTARLWDAGTGQERRVLEGHEGRVFAVAFSPDGRRAATASGDSTILVWDLPGR
jgi:WD40 repeat protein